MGNVGGLGEFLTVYASFILNLQINLSIHKKTGKFNYLNVNTLVKHIKLENLILNHEISLYSQFSNLTLSKAYFSASSNLSNLSIG